MWCVCGLDCRQVAEKVVVVVVVGQVPTPSPYPTCLPGLSQGRRWADTITKRKETSCEGEEGEGERKGLEEGEEERKEL